MLNNKLSPVKEGRGNEPFSKTDGRTCLLSFHKILSHRGALEMT
jgi:hypothetical protein